MPPRTKLGTQLISAAQAAELLDVSPRTVHTWIQKGSIPYIRLPGIQASYKIPLHGLLSSLSGNYDLAAEVETLLGSQEPETPSSGHPAE